MKDAELLDRVRRFRFSAIVVVGDGKGMIGAGLGKAHEVPEAIRKGMDMAKKNMVKVAVAGKTIPYEVIGSYGAGKVLLKPATEGTGLIAGGGSRLAAWRPWVPVGRVLKEWRPPVGPPDGRRH